mmetsp:Transcript_8916/g.14460  ORF Transcript_8916/g.14460 Transcript_8916/m.14460 type:complete len:274 (+) Transcript_8916:9807-10628(+)
MVPTIALSVLQARYLVQMDPIAHLPPQPTDQRILSHVLSDTHTMTWLQIGQLQRLVAKSARQDLIVPVHQMLLVFLRLQDTCVSLDVRAPPLRISLCIEDTLAPQELIVLLDPLSRLIADRDITIPKPLERIQAHAYHAPKILTVLTLVRPTAVHVDRVPIQKEKLLQHATVSLQLVYTSWKLVLVCVSQCMNTSTPLGCCMREIPWVSANLLRMIHVPPVKCETGLQENVLLPLPVTPAHATSVNWTRTMVSVHAPILRIYATKHAKQMQRN